MAKKNNNGTNNTCGFGTADHTIIPDSTKTDPGAKTLNTNFSDWVRKDMAYKEYGVPRVQYS
jgi:hypothetical protein